MSMTSFAEQQAALQQAALLDIAGLAWDKQHGLLPAIVQDADTLQVLMLGYMDRAALQATLDTGLVTFFSRSRNRQWTKGEISGHVLNLIRVQADCDSDALLVLARAQGPTCHLGRASCFASAPENGLARLDRVIAQRVQTRPQGSYTTSLLDAGLARIAQKVGEEGVETALAAVVASDDALTGEAADLVYHLLVLLHARGLSLDDLAATLMKRER